MGRAVARPALRQSDQTMTGGDSIGRRPPRRPRLISGKVATWAARLAAPVVAPLLELKVLASFLSATFVVVLATAVYMELRGARSTRDVLDTRRGTIDDLDQTERF